MRRLNSIIIPLPISIVFLCAFAWAGWHMGGIASRSGLELQIAKMEGLTR